MTTDQGPGAEERLKALARRLAPVLTSQLSNRLCARSPPPPSTRGWNLPIPARKERAHALTVMVGAGKPSGMHGRAARDALVRASWSRTGRRISVKSQRGWSLL